MKVTRREVMSTLSLGTLAWLTGCATGKGEQTQDADVPQQPEVVPKRAPPAQQPNQRDGILYQGYGQGGEEYDPIFRRHTMDEYFRRTPIQKDLEELVALLRLHQKTRKEVAEQARKLDQLGDPNKPFDLKYAREEWRVQEELRQRRLTDQTPTQEIVVTNELSVTGDLGTKIEHVAWLYDNQGRPYEMRKPFTVLNGNFTVLTGEKDELQYRFEMLPPQNNPRITLEMQLVNNGKVTTSWKIEECGADGLKSLRPSTLKQWERLEGPRGWGFISTGGCSDWESWVQYKEGEEQPGPKTYEELDRTLSRFVRNIIPEIEKNIRELRTQQDAFKREYEHRRQLRIEATLKDETQIRNVNNRVGFDRLRELVETIDHYNLLVRTSGFKFASFCSRELETDFRDYYSSPLETQANGHGYRGQAALHFASFFIGKPDWTVSLVDLGLEPAGNPAIIYQRPDGQWGWSYDFDAPWNSFSSFHDAVKDLVQVITQTGNPHLAGTPQYGTRRELLGPGDWIYYDRSAQALGERLGPIPDPEIYARQKLQVCQPQNP